MEYVCGPLHLPSQDKIRMLDFLSDVFEFDVDSEFDKVSRGPLNLKIFEKIFEDSPSACGTKLENKNNGLIFSFKVQNEQELKEIISKYNFFLYRKSNSKEVVEKLELSQTESEKILTIFDIDQRQWRFHYEAYPDI